MLRGAIILVVCLTIAPAKAQLGDVLVGSITDGLVEGAAEAVVGDVPVVGDVVTSIVDEIPISDVVTSLGPLEILGTVNDVTSDPADVLTGVVENVPIAGETVGPILEMLGTGVDEVVETVTDTDVVENLPVDDVTDVVADVVNPVGRVTARTLLRLVLARRLGLLNS